MRAEAFCGERDSQILVVRKSSTEEMRVYRDLLKAGAEL
jgi:hypothetical protein